MKINFKTSMRTSVLPVLRRMIADAALAATCFGLYGLAFGGIGALVQHESQRLIAITGVFALCGAFAGLVSSAYGAVSSADGKSADSSSPASDAVAKDETPVAAVRQLAPTSQRRPHNSYVAI